MGGGTGGRGGGIGGGTGGDGGTGPPQTFQRLTLCQWAVHGKNRFQMVLAPPPPQSLRRGAALAGSARHTGGPVPAIFSTFNIMPNCL